MRSLTLPSILGGLLLGLLLTGCSSSGSTTQRTNSTAVSSSRTWSPEEAETRLRTAARRWEGAPHELGGTSQQGVDCSGLVASVYRNQFETRVPRTTEQQARSGRSVSRSQLQPGDLVLFRPGFKKRHVGIYISDGEFLHASSSEGVRVSSLDNSYWQKHWWQGRRLLSYNDTGASSSQTAASSPSSSSDAPSSATGW